jgi:hypothetical protein
MAHWRPDVEPVRRPRRCGVETRGSYHAFQLVVGAVLGVVDPGMAEIAWMPFLAAAWAVVIKTTFDMVVFVEMRYAHTNQRSEAIERLVGSSMIRIVRPLLREK